MPNIRENYLEVADLAEQASRRSGRSGELAKVMAVSKRWPAETIQKVVDCGHRIFGESRIQEAEEKIPRLPADLDWHFIGHIQKNKVRKILALFQTLHSVDSIGLARRIDHIAAELETRPGIFLQVNIANEASKHGFAPEALGQELGEILALEHVTVLGLMAIPPAVSKPEESRLQFRAVRQLQEDLGAAHGIVFPELSMGMSGDYEVAIEEGATIVRVGSSIFGQRPT